MIEGRESSKWRPASQALSLAALSLALSAALAASARGESRDGLPDLKAQGGLKTARATTAPAEAEGSDPPDPRTTLPPPQVEPDVVKLLAGFGREERPYIQQVVHTVKDLGLLNKQCARKASQYWQRGFKRVAGADEVDLADVSKFNKGYLRYFDPLRAYLRISYKRLYGLKPPERFEKAHKYWLAYLAYALENLDHQRLADRFTTSKPSHSATEVAQYRAWAYRLFKENGLDLTGYLTN